MSGDLISREALKKALKNRNECENCTDIDCINCFYDIIDNAPTVNPCDNCDLYFKAMTKEETKKGGAE